jgi:hypothetical protein
MRIGILTYHYACNHGAVLQAYGLQTALQALGHDPEIIDYRSPVIEAENRHWGIRSGQFRTRLKKRWRFLKFRKRYLRIGRRMRDASSLRELGGRYQAFITGSDQVWNLRLTGGLDQAYFLGFADRGKFRKISYAACFGQTDQPVEWKSELCRLLSDMDSLSVRDTPSAGMVSDLCGRMAAVVVDPTFLINYHSLSTPAPLSGFAFVYILGTEEAEVASAFVSQVQHDTALEVIASLPAGHDLRGAKALRSIGPDEWLGYLEASSFVCTDSYHGVIFAIKNRKPFVAWVRGERSTRITDLLYALGLEDRVIRTPEDLRSKTWLHPIDYTRVFRTLAGLTGISRSFLKKALS